MGIMEETKENLDESRGRISNEFENLHEQPRSQSTDGQMHREDDYDMDSLTRNEDDMAVKT